MNLPILQESAFDDGKGGKFIRLIKKAIGKPDFILKKWICSWKTSLKSGLQMNQL